MNDKTNPFGGLGNKAGDSMEPARHSTDHPGRKYENAEVLETGEQTQSSGVSAPSEPRRPGAGARQAPRRESKGPLKETEPLIPGEILYGAGDVEINAGQPVTTIKVVNASDRPVQIGSHFHFAEVNAGLEFDRDAVWGKRLNILSGGAVRFEPGAVQEVELIPIRGRRIVPGLRGLCGGKLDG
jgi:urease subunit beta